MWALSLIPWWLWLAADVPDLNGPASATIAFTAAAIAVDSIGSRLRAQRALAAQTERAEAGAGAAGRAGGARPHRAGAARRGRPSHVADRGPGRDRAVPPHRTCPKRPARRVRLAQRGGARGADRDAAAARRAAQRPSAGRAAPQPGLADLPALVDAARRAGVPVELSVHRTRRPVPPASGCARTGSCRSRCPTPASTPPGAAVTVSVGHEPTRSCCGWPTDQRAHRPAGSDAPAGHGLTGMRERVALLGGSLSAGPGPDGGFVVSAVLPLGEPA